MQTCSNMKEYSKYPKKYMLVIAKDYVKYFGYTLENRYNPNIDPIYVNTKEFTNDKSFRR